MVDLDDAEKQLGRLMAEAQAGDGEAYLALLTAITPRIRQWIRKGRGFLNDADVEDLLQDVLLSLHAVRNTYDHARPFTPWLAAIARHRLVDAARRYGRQGSHEVGADDLDVTFSPPAANTQEEYGDPEALVHAIEALPPGQRQAIELLKLKELSLKEASATTGLSVGALKLATHRAMASLRRSLSPSHRHED
jgi:RNA polymerase sigma-70 factor (ECF subfamily)